MGFAMTTLAAPLTQPLPSLDAWTAHFKAAEIPILADTAEALEAMRAREDNLDANLIGEMISGDPLMTLKVLAYASTHRGSRMVTDTETVIATLVMMGISPFFRAFGPQPTVEDRLASEPEALAGLLDTLRRGHRSATFALGLAVQRLDRDAAVIHEAALLHDFVELLLWLCAPALAQAIEARKQADPKLRTAAAQQDLLHIDLDDLEHTLMLKWRLPALLVQITDEHATKVTAQMRNVQLALRVARHSALGWDNPALPDDVLAVAELLNIAPESAERLLREIDSD